MQVRILLYEDNDDLREGLSMIIRGTPGMELIGAFSNCAQVLQHIQSLKPDVVLMDIDMPLVDGLEGVRLIRGINNALPILMLTVFEDDEHIFDALRLGANGYLLKKTPPAKIFEAITDVINGGAPMTASIARKVLQFLSSPPASSKNEFELTPREKTILSLLVQGNSVKMIATETGISPETVKTHFKKIYEKLSVHNQSEAVAKAIRHRVV